MPSCVIIIAEVIDLTNREFQSVLGVGVSGRVLGRAAYAASVHDKCNVNAQNCR
jgi:hypothetical protein